jgi:hypothetical protein
MVARFRSRRRSRRPLVIGAVAGATALLVSALLFRRRLQPATASTAAEG